jgi:hypothetical protein
MHTTTNHPGVFTYRFHPHLYEINTWAWLEQLSAQYGRHISLGDVPDREWDALRAQGFDFVWLMGIWKRSGVGRRIDRTDTSRFASYDQALPKWRMRDVVGSPYSIQDYSPDPHLATWDQLDGARRQLNALGMGLILDFVPNHTGFDHAWIKSHPEYYVVGTPDDFRKSPSAYYLVERPDTPVLVGPKGVEGRGPEGLRQAAGDNGAAIFVARAKDPYFPPWLDVAQLNYFQPATREAMIGELRRVAAHCDGVRCDMAMLVLNEIFAKTWGPLVSHFPPPASEFWTEAIAAVPGFVWIAEVYWDLESRLQQLGFNFTYDKGLYDRLRDGQIGEIRQRLQAGIDYQRRAVRFLENHDEERSLKVFGKERLQAAGTLMGALPGMRFYHQGQLEGRKLKLPVQLSRMTPEAPDPEVRVFYEKILRITNGEAFHQGEWRLLEVHSDGDDSSANLIAWRWSSGLALKVIVVNLSPDPAQGRLNLEADIDAMKQYTFFDQLNEVSYPRAGSDLRHNGLRVRLDGHRAHIFDVAAV